MLDSNGSPLAPTVPVGYGHDGPVDVPLKVARTGAAGLLQVFGDGDDNPGGKPGSIKTHPSLATPDLR